MPKIEPGGFFKHSGRTRGRSGSSVSSPNKMSFNNMLARAQESTSAAHVAPSGELPTSEHLESLLDSIHSQGAQLARERSWSALTQYRQLIQRFLKLVVHSGMDIAQYVSGRNVTNRKQFSLVVIINEKLNHIAEGIRNSQGTQIEILHSVGEIFGLLVDLRS